MLLVPWRVQGAVKNEERLLNHSIKLLDKEIKQQMRSITRDQKFYQNKYQKFQDRMNTCVNNNVSTTVTESKTKVPEAAEVVAEKNKKPLIQTPLWRPGNGGKSVKTSLNWYEKTYPSRGYQSKKAWNLKTAGPGGASEEHSRTK